MTLVGVIAQHPWLDTRMRITGYQPISSESSWTTSGLKLGSAVNAVVQHLQLNPPEIIQITDESLQRIQASIAPQQQQQVNQTPKNVSSGASEPPPDYNTVLHAEEESVEMSHMVSLLTLTRGRSQCMGKFVLEKSLTGTCFLHRILLSSLLFYAANTCRPGIISRA